MRLAQRLNSFPVIVVAALLLAALFGLGVGFVTSSSSASVLPQAAVGANSVDAEGSFDAPLEGDGTGGTRRGTDRSKREDSRGSSSREDTTRNGNETDTGPDPRDPDGERLPIVNPGVTRTLPEGRVDEIQSLEEEAIAKPECSIEVSVADTRGTILPFALLALDVKSGPLGWHLVPSQPQAVPEQRGLFRFANLYPGEYRLRSLASNYQPAEELVRLQGATDVEHVSLVLQPLEYAQVEFFIYFPDSTSPEEVELSIQKPGQEDTSTGGRFHEYEVDLTATTRAMGVIPATRMRQRTGTGGMIRLTLPKDQQTVVAFAANRDSQRYEGSASVKPTGGISQESVTLQPTESDNKSVLPNNPRSLGNLNVTLTLAGKEAEFTAINLRQSVEDFQYRPPQTTDGNKYTWQNVYDGKWFLVAESAAFHAPYVAEVEVSGETSLALDIRTGHLRVTAVRASGTPDPTNGEARYRVRLRPRGSGTIERAYNGNLTGKQTDFIDFFVPVGDYDVRVESPENYPKLSVAPVAQSFVMADDGDVKLSYTLSAATKLIFQCVDATGSPIQNAEFLVTFHPAGQVPESERENVMKAGYNGICETDMAPSGPVYIMIWAEGSDWANPDKVFQVDLPAYAEKNLGAVVVTH